GLGLDLASGANEAHVRVGSFASILRNPRWVGLTSDRRPMHGYRRSAVPCHWQKSKARPPLARLIRDAAGSSCVRSRSWLRPSAGDGEDVVTQDLGQQVGSGPRRAFQVHSGEVATLVRRSARASSHSRDPPPSNATLTVLSSPAGKSTGKKRSSLPHGKFRPPRDRRDLLRNVGDGRGQAASDCWLTVSMPSMNFTPVISFGNWLWPSRRRQLFSAACASLKTMAIAVLFERHPLERTVRCRTVANVLSMGLVVRTCFQCSAG